MDDARRWTATAPETGPAAPAAMQPGDPWGAPEWGLDRRAAGVPTAMPGTPAGVWRRGAALAVDLIVAAILWTVGTQLALGLTRIAPRLDLVAEAFGRTWQLVVPVAYFVLGHGTGGQTVGKRLLGARVVDEGGAPIGYLRALGRCVATAAAAIPFGLGLLVAGFRRDRRGLHDFLAGTRVVRVR